MNFSDKLNEYLRLLNCTARELSDSCRLSSAVISRYRNGERIPAPDSEQLDRLIRGICTLAEKKGIPALTENEVRTSLEAPLLAENTACENLSGNFDLLISTLGINLSELARAMNYDASYLSRIRSGNRRPADPGEFSEKVCRFVVRHYQTAEQRSALAYLTGQENLDFSDPNVCLEALSTWLFTGKSPYRNPVDTFLHKLDSFDLNDYIRSIHFDTLKVPSAPFLLPTSKSYIGLEEMKNGELDFFKATVLSRSNHPVFMCSDMQMDDMAKDLDFGKKWMFGLAMILKKGLHLNMIHNVERPFNEMMLGLESWIPLYMTGLVSPYYLRGVHNTVYSHLLYTSGSAALSGDCITGHHNECRYYLTKNPAELSWYQKKSERLLSKAAPLMDIYREETKHQFYAFLDNDANVSGNRRQILSSPPLYTLPEDMLRKILTRNNISADETEQICSYAAQARKQLQKKLQECTVTDEIALLNKEEFEKHPLSLALADLFLEKDVFYTFEEYQEHLRQCRSFARKYSGYRITENTQAAFRNIEIRIHEGRWVMLSKNCSPVIHFVIFHPKMRSALENFAAPVVE